MREGFVTVSKSWWRCLLQNITLLHICYQLNEVQMYFWSQVIMVTTVPLEVVLKPHLFHSLFRVFSQMKVPVYMTCISISTFVWICSSKRWLPCRFQWLLSLLPFKYVNNIAQKKLFQVCWRENHRLNSAFLMNML